MSNRIDISGLDKGVLLAELFNRSQVMGLGVLQAGRGPQVMSHDEGRRIVEETLAKKFGHDTAMAFGRLDGRLHFDYLYGRPLKVDLSGDGVDPWGYDRDNGGPGTLAGIVAHLRSEVEADA
jgi:hypothetical protein